MLFRASNIKWDTDGQGDCGLPVERIVEIDDATEEDHKHEAVGIALHNAHGFNPVTYQFQPVAGGNSCDSSRESHSAE